MSLNVHALGQTNCVTSETFWIIFVKRDLIQVNNIEYEPKESGGVRMKNTIIKHVNLIVIGYTSVSGEAAVAAKATLPHAVDYILDPCLGMLFHSNVR